MVNPNVTFSFPKLIYISSIVSKTNINV